VPEDETSAEELLSEELLLVSPLLVAEDVPELLWFSRSLLEEVALLEDAVALERLSAWSRELLEVESESLLDSKVSEDNASSD